MADSPLQKAMQVLRRVIERGEPVGVQQLAQELRLNVSTVHRVLQVLIQEGMVSYEQRTRLYGIGAESIRFATAALGAKSLVGRVRPTVRALADQLAETCAFSLYDAQSFTMVVAVVERGPHPLGYAFDVGHRDPVNAGASGKAILAFLPDEDIDAFFASAPLVATTERTVIDETALRADIAAIRERGYATSHGERVPGAGMGVGVPVFGREGLVIGALVLTVPLFRHHPDTFAARAEIVMEAARTLSGLIEPETLRTGLRSASADA